LEVDYPDLGDSDCPLTYRQAWEWGVSLGLRKPRYGTEYDAWKVPTFILLAPKRVAFGFFEGLCSTSRNKEMMRRIVSKKEHALRYQMLGHRIGMLTSLFMHKIGYRVSFLTAPANKKFGVRRLPDVEQYVYDLTTSNHHFSAGIGKLVVHNTDSCFVKLSRELCDAPDRIKLIERAHEVGEVMAGDITAQFLKPVLMEYESAFEPPFVLLKKKRYFGKLCLPGKAPKIYMKGVECIRRDYCDMVIKTQRRMIELILDEKIDEAVSFVQGVMKRLYAGDIPLDDLAMSKKLSQKPEDYKTTAAHVELAIRLGTYDAGERVEYFIRAGYEPLNKRAITREETSAYPLDYDFYAEKQLRNPIQRIMDLVVKRKVFLRRAITAPVRSGSLVKYLKVGSRRARREVRARPKKVKLSDADIRSFF
jgi:hypothetical protein